MADSVPAQRGTIDLEQACADAVSAAKAALKRHGIERPSVVVNFAWKDGGGEPWAVGTAVPKTHRRALGESLYTSATVDADFDPDHWSV